MRTIVHEVEFDVGLQRLFAGDAERADEWLRQTVENVLARETSFDTDRYPAIGTDPDGTVHRIWIVALTPRVLAVSFGVTPDDGPLRLYRVGTLALPSRAVLPAPLALRIFKQRLKP